jgi:deoxyribonuclease V
VDVFFCTDVHYDDANDAAHAAAVGFWHSRDAHPSAHFTRQFFGIAPYEPGAFHRRELPCILGLVERVRAEQSIELLLVDGHTWLGEGTPGLGHHLWRALQRQIPVIGIAKKRFHEGFALEVTRGTSASPLFVSAVGVDAQHAADFVRGMHGHHRIPTLLRLVDTLCRESG